MLENSLSVGQSVRSMSNPAILMADKTDTLNTSIGGNTNAKKKVNNGKEEKRSRAESVRKGRSGSVKSTTSERAESLERPEQKVVKPVYETFNMVVYGLPNFVVP